MSPKDGESPAATGLVAKASVETSPASSTLAPPAANGQPVSPYLLVEQVAARYRLSVRTVREWARLGRIPHSRRPRSRRLLFLPGELAAWDAGASLEVLELPDSGRVVRPRL